MIRILTILSLFLGANAFAQGIDASNFVIDRSRPYVYLRFDHIGSRKPILQGESNVGLWIKVVNNCRLPILFRAIGTPSGENGIILEDEVVERKPLFQIFTSPHQEEDADAKMRLHLEKLKHIPEGYSFEVSGRAKVQPGEEIVFSVPLNHVDEDWYLRVKFALDLAQTSLVVGPFTYLPFHIYDIPKEDRPGKPTASPPKPASPGSTALHESGHVNVPPQF